MELYPFKHGHVSGRRIDRLWCLVTLVQAWSKLILCFCLWPLDETILSAWSACCISERPNLALCRKWSRWELSCLESPFLSRNLSFTPAGAMKFHVLAYELVLGIVSWFELCNLMQGFLFRSFPVLLYCMRFGYRHLQGLSFCYLTQFK